MVVLLAVVLMKINLGLLLGRLHRPPLLGRLHRPPLLPNGGAAAHPRQKALRPRITCRTKAAAHTHRRKAGRVRPGCTKHACALAYS